MQVVRPEMVGLIDLLRNGATTQSPGSSATPGLSICVQGPLLRILLRLAEDEHVLVLVLHIRLRWLVDAGAGLMSWCSSMAPTVRAASRTGGLPIQSNSGPGAQAIRIAFEQLVEALRPERSPKSNPCSSMSIIRSKGCREMRAANLTDLHIEGFEWDRSTTFDLDSGCP
ncbi:hypothetical protein FQR65_LT20375 [Abscondita terminalis]|nr:hypothetical protein FQR65_LT20375 [Abscondita terminalis]